MTGLLLDSEEALAHGLAELARQDEVIARLHAEGIRPPLRKRPAGIPGLVSIVVGQQVSVASADAIRARLDRVLGPITAERLAAASDEELRAGGLSAPKMRALRAIAAASLSGTLPLDRLADLPAEEAHAALVAVKGIGPWTADVYLLFCLGHPDIFPAGDLALQEAARTALDLAERPDAKALALLAERWRPWRGVAAKTLWAYYRRGRSSEAAPV